MLPAVTGSGVPTLVTRMSACPAPPTAILTVTKLSPGTVSRVVVVTVAASEMIVPLGVPGFTLTTTWKLAVVAGGKVAIVQVMFPVPPTAGKMQAQPTGVTAEKNVAFAGTAWVKLTVAALPGPLLVTVWV